MSNDKSLEKLIGDLKERAKELNCLYKVQELLNNPDLSIEQICTGIVQAIPPGWQFPDVCQAKIVYGDQVFQSADFKETRWLQCADIKVQDETVGKICVYYTEERPAADEGPF